MSADTLGLYWDHPFHQLGQDPAVGGPSGAQPYTANDRMMEGFGSIDWPQPLMAVDQQINGAKGRMFRLQPPTAVNRITQLARRAVGSDQDTDADALLSSIRNVSPHCMILLIRFCLHPDAAYRHSPFSST